MKNILIIGAGRSSYPLIQYLLEQAPQQAWFITVADSSPERASSKIGTQSNARAIWLDVTKSNDRKELISRSDVVISLLPAHLHLEVAHDCIKLKKDILTSSHITHQMFRLGDEARDRELLFTGEMGLEPGLEHMSIIQNLNQLKEQGAKINAFRSYTGGLLAQDSPSNPWGYKFTWNPRNVVLAGQGTAQYLVDNKLRYQTYNTLFRDHTLVKVPECGTFESFGSRDSLLYREAYGLIDVPNIYRGTLREQGFCAAWNALIQLGLTDGDFPILHSDNISYYQLVDGIVGDVSGNTLKERVANLLEEEVDGPVIQKLQWLGLFSKKKIKLPRATPALILEHLLREKWLLNEGDKDRIIIHHQFDYELGRKKYTRYSTLDLVGDNHENTAVAKAVGLPIAVLFRYITENDISDRGVGVPLEKRIYEPVLAELATHGLAFKTFDEAK
ncbi:MAG: saccharopine dehydrogenase C-terminal domain-containing protein [Bacteroidota bacterium]